MTHQPIAVANEFIREFGADNEITHLKLQKLVYFAQGWWLAFKGEPMLTERPQVWRYGPVFQSLYQIFSLSGRDRITQIRGSAPFVNVGAPPTLEGDDFEEERACVKWVWGEYGNSSAARLSDLTHAIDTPWRKIAEKNSFSVELNTEIPPELDWEYFAKLAKERGFTPEPFREAAA